ncbi:MAG TPA: acylphosphatase [Gemmatimonadaceae bacterium]|jgi:acylphosphatase
MPRVRLHVRGAVQGVGFRWFVRDAAHRLGISGWVRNHEDGSVEIAADGSEGSIERFVDDVTRGPRGASVASVARDPLGEDETLPSPFVIRR